MPSTSQWLLDCNILLISLLLSQFMQMTIQNKIVKMQHMPKNGYFLERRKMFVDAPFHNLFSNVPLNWKGEETTTEEAQRHIRKQMEERQQMKRAYQISVEERMSKRYSNFDHSNGENEMFNRKNHDILAKQLEMFNKSKVLMTHELPESRINNYKQTINHQQTYQKPQNPHQNPHNKSLYHQAAPNEEQGDKHTNHTEYNPEQSSRLRQRHLESSTINYQLPPEHPEYQGYDRMRQYSPASGRYRSLESPYPRRDLGKQIEQLYTGSKQGQYPFRNVKPDELQNFLRQKTKADRKRAYQVSLNLFKK